MKKYLCLILCLLVTVVEGGIPVLVYHGIVKKEGNLVSNFEISEAKFNEHMKALKRAGYQTITVEDLVGYLNGQENLPSKPLMITFDGGQRGALHADPLLKRLQFKAILFVSSDPELMKTGQSLNWDELNRLFQSKRWDIQACGHFYHHLIPVNDKGDKGNFASNKKWLLEKSRLENDLEYQERLLGDLQKNKSEIQSQIPGANPTAFAFPFGDYGIDGMNVSQAVGIPVTMDNIQREFSLAFILIPIFCQQGGDFTVHQGTNALLLPRFIDNGFLSGEELVRIFDEVISIP